MTKVILPRTSQVGTNEWSDVEANDVAIREVINGGLDNSNLTGSAGITRANLATDARPWRWYTPTVIAAEESRESTSFGTMTTADQVTGVELNENALLAVWYSAYWRTKNTSEGGGEGQAGIFLGENQIKIPTGNGDALAEGAVKNSELLDHPFGSYWQPLTTHGGGLITKENHTDSGTPARVNTGEIVGFDFGSGVDAGGPVYVRAAAGTYTVSIRFKASAGPVRVKNRYLYVATIG